MAASDPTMGVPTPTGVLQGVAAFSWDGSAWQPSGRAGPSVATPTGVLRGVAAFNGGPSWQPSGRAGPDVATPTGVLDGVAVYTWSGSAWTPPGGQTTPSTPTGTLRGVAAFNWDGAAWQPAGQAGPDVATPYGVLQGVAMFNWSGTAWAPAGAPSLSLDFMTPGTLDPRITFTRASTATYTDATGTIQTAATNAPRWDYDPVTHQLRGLLIEEARTNIALQSAVGSSPWTAWGSITAPTETPNAVAAPDGTLTATSLAFPAVTAGATSILYQNITPTAAPYAFSAWLRGAVGGERVWLAVANGAIYYSAPAVLTSAWRRFVLITPTLPAASLPFYVGVDLRDATQTPTSAQTVYAWGGQVEQGAFATSYIPTAAAAVTRAQDSCAIPPANMAPWFISPGGSWFAEFDFFNPSPGNSRIVGPTNVAGGITPLFLTAAPVNGSAYDGVGAIASTNPTTPNSVVKMVSTWAVGQAKFVTNAGAVASTASMTAGYAALGSSGTSFMMVSPTLADNTSGHLRRVSYWPRALSDAEMQQVTT